MTLLFLNLWLLALGFTQAAQTVSPFLYSPYGDEMVVSFNARYLTNFKTVEEMEASLPADRSYYANYTIEPTLKHLFGPLTKRGMGGIKKHLKIQIQWSQAVVSERGVVLPYSYQGLWLMDGGFLDHRDTPVPLPFNTTVILSKDWKLCTDSHHDTESFYWYYWDPSRYGCDHQLGTHFQNVILELSAPTSETQQTYPEYGNMIRFKGGQKIFPLTIGFGYYEEPDEPRPDSDSDVGAREYQAFLRELKRLIPNDTKATPIMRSEYPHFWGDDFAIGHRFLFKKEGVLVDLKVVMNARIDQMILFARSYAEQHDGYFAWLGHSRVGSGFDATRFAMMIKDQPNIYSISKEYQLIYWGGCNSYSYYTEPFFKLKAELNPDDPNGTRFLDIVANGLPSYFGINSDNALIHFKALLNWTRPTSYQEILTQMENLAGTFGVHVLAIVLGDEDNETSTAPL
jgi:hypothetical protein